MDEVKVLLDSIERIYSNIENIEQDAFKNNYNKYVIIKSNLDTYRDRLEDIKNALDESNVEESKNEINAILSELLGDGIEEETEEDFNPKDVSELLENMPDDVYPEENLTDEYVENDFDKTEVLFDASEIDAILNTPDFQDQVLPEQEIPQEDHIEEQNLDALDAFEIPELDNLENEMLEIPTVEPVGNIDENQNINLDELNSMIETFE